MAKQHTYTWFSVSQYSDFLTRWGFNDEQIDFTVNQRNNYESLKRHAEIEECECCHNRKKINHFDHDTYEREMWYTMNRSGLFEDDEENKTGITNWEPTIQDDLLLNYNPYIKEIYK